jgi:hypothetical protein
MTDRAAEVRGDAAARTFLSGLVQDACQYLVFSSQYAPATVLDSRSRILVSTRRPHFASVTPVLIFCTATFSSPARSPSTVTKNAPKIGSAFNSKDHDSERAVMTARRNLISAGGP